MKGVDLLIATSINSWSRDHSKRWKEDFLFPAFFTVLVTYQDNDHGDYQMPDTVKLESSSIEEVAYKLMVKIVGNAENDEKKLLKTYEKCLKIVRGYEYEEVMKS